MQKSNTTYTLLDSTSLTRRQSFWLTFFLSVVIFVSGFFIVSSFETIQSLDWDESVYALKARSWSEGSPADSFYIYRPIGVPLFAYFFGVHSNFSLDAMRLFGVFSATFFLVFLFLLASRLSSVFVGLTVTILFGSTMLFMRNAPVLANDLAASGLLFGVLWLLWRHYLSDGRDSSIYGAVILGALAFYVRYGVALHLCIIFGLTAFLFLLRFYNPHRVGKEKESVFFLNPSLKAIVLFLALLLPHIIQSLWLFDRDPLGILRFAGKASNREYLGEGLVDYIQWMPSLLAGVVPGALAFLGIFSVFVLFFSRYGKSFFSSRNHLVGVYWIMSIAFIVLFFTGLLTHAEERYIIFPMVLFVIVGIIFLQTFLDSLFRGLGAIFLVCILCYGLQAGQANLYRANALFAGQMTYRTPIVAAGEAISVAADGAPCFVWTTAEPQISWYSRCRAFTYDADTILEYLKIYRDNHSYITIFHGMDKVEPDIEYLMSEGVTFKSVETNHTAADVYRIFYAGDGGDGRLTTEQQIY